MAVADRYCAFCAAIVAQGVPCSAQPQAYIQSALCFCDRLPDSEWAKLQRMEQGDILILAETPRK